MKKRSFTILLSAILTLSALAPVSAQPVEYDNVQHTEEIISVESDLESLDYSQSENWIACGTGDDKDVDVFWICPSISGNGADNVELNQSNKKLFDREYSFEKTIYEDVGRMYAPYYRQIGLLGYKTSEKDEYLNNAYADIADAFEYYIENENDGRPLILAGFSQGADMCYRILENFYGGDSAKAVSLRKGLVAVYAIGWALTDDMIDEYPQLVPAKGEKDTGVVVSWECEDDRYATISGNIVIPEGEKMHAINPLNWNTDSVSADKSLNDLTVLTGKVNRYYKNYCGAYLDDTRGCLKVTDLTDTFKLLPFLKEGSLHLYDLQLFYGNHKQNVAVRTAAYLEAQKKETTFSENELKTVYVNGYTISYPASLSFTGKKLKINKDNIKVTSQDGTKIAVKQLKFKNNKKAGDATFIIKKLDSKDKTIKKALKNTTLTFKVTPFNISDTSLIVKKKEGKYLKIKIGNKKIKAKYGRDYRMDGNTYVFTGNFTGNITM